MNNYIRTIAISLAVLLVIPACQAGGRPESGETGDARTYFESLDLETPEGAVHTFAHAFQREDFMTVYLVLDLEAQRQQRMDFSRTFSWQHLVGETASEGLINDGTWEKLIQTTVDPWYLFDQIMLYASKQDDLLIDLRGDHQISRSEGSEARGGRQAVDVIANVDGVSGEVVFQMVTDRDGRWRVYMVSAPGEGLDSWPSALLSESP